MARSNVPAGHRDSFDGDLTFLRGMQSALEPVQITDGGYVWSMNTVNRGGLLQCRPGYEIKFCLPDGKLQGGCLFRSRRNASEQIVCVVDGRVYVSDYPFKTYYRLADINLSPRADMVYFAVADQTVELNPDGSKSFINPRAVLFIQDGLSPAAWFDGGQSGHNAGAGLTPMGTHMAFSGGRLWVAREEKLFGSDIYDPFTFIEGYYLGGSDSFVLPGAITGMAEMQTTGLPHLIVFTDSSTTIFQSGLRDRTQWPATNDFQKLLLPTIGCVAARSVTSHYGLLWWFSQHGLTRFDTALMSQQSSRLTFLDVEMGISKSRLDGNLSKIAGASFENYLLMSVPFADNYNRHTWVLDESGLGQLEEGGTTSTWNSFWMGTRPVQWMSGLVAGQSRVYHVSKDYDGKNRLWEAFINERRDNGCDILWAACTRGYAGKSISDKALRYADFYFSEMEGEVDMKISWAGATRGRFKPLFAKRVKSARGSVDATSVWDTSTEIYACKKQSRILRSPEVNTVVADSLTSCGVERPKIEAEDQAFMFLILVQGVGALRGIRVFMDARNEHGSGECQQDETRENMVRFDGAATADDDLEEAYEDLASDLPVEYTSTQSVSYDMFGVQWTASGVASSPVTQAAADKVALQLAKRKAGLEAQRVLPPTYGPWRQAGG